MAICPVAPNAGLIGGLIDTVDCHIRVLVHDSYRELVGPGTTFARCSPACSRFTSRSSVISCCSGAAACACWICQSPR
ncbi:MAG: hypothetical protein WDM79_02525 [Terricaulis sp.]